MQIFSVYLLFNLLNICIVNILLLHARYEQIMYSCATAHRRGRHKECVVGTEINRFLGPGRGAETESAGLAAGGRAS